MSFKKIRFVTDSVCDIPADLIKQHQIEVVPCYVNYDDQSFQDDGVQLIREDFYRKLPSMKKMPTTAAPAPGLTEAAITRAAADDAHVIIITTPATLSGIFNAMRIGAAKLPAERVTLIDSGILTMGIGWQVIIGAQVAAETGDLTKTLDAIQKVRQNQKLYAGLATMEFLRRGGRVSWAQAAFGSLLQIKPILNVYDGKVEAVERVRTFRNAVKKLVELSEAQAPLDKLAILHANNLEGAQELKDMLKGVAPADTLIAAVGPTLGTHIGPGALAVALVSAQWRR
jgi:DegV family protein with EDD domain